MKRWIGVILMVMVVVLAVQPTSWAEESLEVVYARYVKALIGGDIDSALGCMNKYHQGTWAAQNQDQRTQALNQWKYNCFANYTVVKSEIKGNRAFLYVKARGVRSGEEKERDGKVSFVNENGQWKVYSASYD